MSATNPIKLVILWHMHQPDYRDPDSGILGAPWVRLHATKDYLDMLQTASRFSNLKMTFNLVPSLIEQLQHYVEGGTDNHLELTRLDSQNCDDSQKSRILDNMFKCNVERMIKPHPRFNYLYEKWQDFKRNQNHLSISNDEIRDAQVWSNLVWVDPLYHTESPIIRLTEKSESFTELDKQELIDWQINHIKKIIPAYKEQSSKEQIEVSFSPYFHPILPLLCDFESAKESLNDITLPRKKFRHPEDARYQIEKSKEMFNDIFDKELTGMWPSEGSVSDETIKLCAESGIKWLASDEQILYRSIQKSGMDPSSNHPYGVYEHESGVKLLFRDHMLSDKIGFVYSNWEPKRAAEDFIAHIKNIGHRLSHLSNEIVVPVILDGENAWEYYANDGNDFLNSLYESLSSDAEIETVTFSEAVEQLPATKFKTIFAGSWINHNFRIWIGHQEDNTAWDHLSETREHLENFQNDNPGYDPEKLKSAWRHIYIAEGSDWFWWYGDEHRGPENHRFDLMFRKNLLKVYDLLGSTPPVSLNVPITSQSYISPVQIPDALVTPHIDGKISHFYEWFGGGIFECALADSTMHRVFKLISRIHFGFDRENFYIRLDFTNSASLNSVANLRFDILFEAPDKKRIALDVVKLPFDREESGIYKFAIADILELSVMRSFLWTESHGVLAFKIEISEGEKLLEQWPENGTISCEVPEKNKELFWHQS